jgi:hypothetical protein
MDDEQLKIIRAMTPAQRLRLSKELYWTARKLKAAGFRAQHPEWTEERVQAEVRAVFLYGHT